MWKLDICIFNLDKYIWQFGQIQLEIWTNTFGNLDKSIQKFWVKFSQIGWIAFLSVCSWGCGMWNVKTRHLYFLSLVCNLSLFIGIFDLSIFQAFYFLSLLNVFTFHWNVWMLCTFKVWEGWLPTVYSLWHMCHNKASLRAT